MSIRNFISEIKAFRLLLVERFLVLRNSPRKQLYSEIRLTGVIIRDFILLKLFGGMPIILIGFMVCIIGALGYYLFDFLTFYSVDNLLEKHQSAKAAKQLQWKQKVFPNSLEAKVRLAHVHLQMNNVSKSIDIIRELQSNNQFKDIEYLNLLLGKLATQALSNKFDISKKEEIFHLLANQSLHCTTCQNFIVQAGTELGYKAQEVNNLIDAEYFLEKALTAAIELDPVSVDLPHRKKQLASIYVKQAETKLKDSFQHQKTNSALFSEQVSQSLKLYENAVQLVPNGNSYLKIARLHKLLQYSNTKDKVTGYQNSLSAYKYAIHFEIDNATIEYNKTREILQSFLAKNNYSQSQIQDIIENYPNL